MRKHGSLSLLCILGLLASIEGSQAAQYYRAGDFVQDFTLHTRRAWTNHAGRFFWPGAAVRLSDFAGHVVFFEFFDPT